MEFFGITVADCPDYRIIKMDEDMAKYKPDSKDLDAESVAAFTRKVLEGQASVSLAQLGLVTAGQTVINSSFSVI